jgi:hypothetical protein
MFVSRFGSCFRCVSPFQCGSSLGEDEKVDGLHVLICFITDSVIDSQLTHTVQSSPIHQLKQIFLEMNTWIVEASRRALLSSTIFGSLISYRWQYLVSLLELTSWVIVDVVLALVAQRTQSIF